MGDCHRASEAPIDREGERESRSLSVRARRFKPRTEQGNHLVVAISLQPAGRSDFCRASMI